MLGEGGTCEYNSCGRGVRVFAYESSTLVCNFVGATLPRHTFLPPYEKIDAIWFPVGQEWIHQRLPLREPDHCRKRERFFFFVRCQESGCSVPNRRLPVFPGMIDLPSDESAAKWEGTGVAVLPCQRKPLTRSASPQLPAGRLTTPRSTVTMPMLIHRDQISYGRRRSP